MNEKATSPVAANSKNRNEKISEVYDYKLHKLPGFRSLHILEDILYIGAKDRVFRRRFVLQKKCHSRCSHRDQKCVCVSYVAHYTIVVRPSI